MKRIIWALLFSFITSFGFSQNQRIDDLKQRLATATTDTIRVHLLSNLCNSLSGINPDSALYYGDRAVALARKIKYPKGEIQALSFTSGVLNSSGNLPKALSMAFEALQIAEKHKLEAQKKWPFIFISGVYASLKDFSKAIHFRMKALRIAEAENQANSIIIENLSVGNLYIQAEQLDSASFFLNRALKLWEAKPQGSKNAIMYGLGEIEARKGHHVLAMAYFQQSLNLLDSTNHRALSRIYMSIASLYKNKNQRDSSIYFAKKALQESQPILNKLNIIEASTLLSELYEDISEKESYDYYKLAVTTKESLFGAGNIQAIQEMIALEEERKREVARVNAAFQNQLKQYALLVGLVLLLLIAFFLYRNNQKEKKARNLLQIKNEEIQLTLSQLKSTQSQLIQSEKMASLGELTAGIAHEIQNPLNFVNNFSEVNKELAEELEQEVDKGNTTEVKALAKDIKENQEKILHHGKRADAIVKGMLQHSRSSSGTKEPTDINALADEYLRLAYHGLRAKDKSFNATMKTDFDETIRNINIIPQDIGRVILNLITNAFYAVAERKKLQGESFEPTVTVSTKRLSPAGGGKGVVEISVKDNGNGIPDSIKEKIFQPFFTTKPTGQGTGLGLSLSYDIVKAHKGELEVKTKEGEGSEFIIQLPIHS
jgi:two-component system, NtrC family, sensor kinase